MKIKIVSIYDCYCDNDDIHTDDIIKAIEDASLMNMPAVVPVGEYDEVFIEIIQVVESMALRQIEQPEEDNK